MSPAGASGPRGRPALDQRLGILRPDDADVRRVDHLLQRPVDLQRAGSTPAADDQAADPPGMAGRSEQPGWRADVGADQVRIGDVPLVEDPDQELAHRHRGEQIGAPFGAAEAGQVDGQQPRDAGQPRPDRVEGVQALGPRAGQHEVLAGRAVAVGIADLQPVHRAVPHLHLAAHGCSFGGSADRAFRRAWPGGSAAGLTRSCDSLAEAAGARQPDSGGSAPRWQPRQASDPC